MFKVEQSIANLVCKGFKFKLKNKGYIKLAHFTDSAGYILFLAEHFLNPQIKNPYFPLIN